MAEQQQVLGPASSNGSLKPEPVDGMALTFLEIAKCVLTRIRCPDYKPSAELRAVMSQDSKPPQYTTQKRNIIDVGGEVPSKIFKIVFD